MGLGDFDFQIVGGVHLLFLTERRLPVLGFNLPTAITRFWITWRSIPWLYRKGALPTQAGGMVGRIWDSRAILRRTLLPGLGPGETNLDSS